MLTWRRSDLHKRGRRWHRKTGRLCKVCSFFVSGIRDRSQTFL